MGVGSFISRWGGLRFALSAQEVFNLQSRLPRSAEGWVLDIILQRNWLLTQGLTVWIMLMKGPTATAKRENKRDKVIKWFIIARAIRKLIPETGISMQRRGE